LNVVEEIPSSASGFSQLLLGWYAQNHRDLPWRQTKDPYRIWLSEIILQQTRVAQGLPYYEKFVESYPDLGSLATADEQEVLRLWQGLGYYSRARNMLKTARFIQEHLGGFFPDRYEDLIKLGGIGTYTAAAIASFAFGQPVVAVDGNVFRFLARYFGITIDISASNAKGAFKSFAEQLQPAAGAADFNQALIEFGALQCKPVQPNCSICDFRSGCYAFANNRVAELPLKTKKTKVRTRYLDYVVFENEGKLALKQRKSGDVWQGLYDFFLIESEAEGMAITRIEEGIRSVIGGGQARIHAPVGPFVHILSHQRLLARFWKVELGEPFVGSEGLSFFTNEEIDVLPKPVLITNYLKDYLRKPANRPV
jgi:A/G-specific adenine glycosylase